MDDIDSEMLAALIARVNSGHWDGFLSQGQGYNWCRHPVRIRGVIAEGGETAPSGSRRTPFPMVCS
jgi:hypothetical protein